MVFLVILFPFVVFGQTLSEEWVKRYSNGSAADLAVDAVGNVYVTGTSGSDFATIKYDANGNELWVSKYRGEVWNSVAAIAVDSIGNVYVTGKIASSYDPWGRLNGDCITIKYDTNGNEEWVKRYDGGYGDESVGLKVDAWGNVYVAGTSYANYIWQTGVHGSDYFAIKYDTNGNEKWVRRYRTAYDAKAAALTMDSAGNVYVTGTAQYSHGGTDFNDIATVKYDTNGYVRWVKRYSGPSFGWPWQSDGATAIAVDQVGNVYVSGWSEVGEGIYDYVLIKYDVNGNEKWVKRYSSYYHRANAIAVNPSGNIIYVTGNAGTTIRFDSNGNELWVKSYPCSFSHLAIDSLGNAYVAGTCYLPEPSYVIINYDPNGNEVWSNKHNLSWGARLTDIEVDSLGNIYVTGIDNYSEYVTIKYSKTALPKPPTSLVASDIPCDNGGGIILNWVMSPDDPAMGPGNNKVAGYNIYRSTTSGGPYEAIGNTLAGVSSFVDNSASTGTYYHYIVRDTDSMKESVDSNEASAASARNLPLPPTDLTAIDTPYDLGGSITLSWTKSADDGAGLNNVAAYNIYRYSAANGTIATLASLQSGMSGYVDDTTVDTDTYYYFIKSYDNQCSAESEASNIASGQSVNNFTALSGYIESLSGISPELTNSMTGKVENAVASYERGSTQAAINMLNALLNEISAQTGKKIDADAAATLTTYVQNLINYIR